MGFLDNPAFAERAMKSLIPYENEAINYFASKFPQPKHHTSPLKTISITRQTEITMPQMANSALSENWFLKEIGDIHWKLISDGLEQKSSAFKDENGNRLYATFTRISYSVSNLKSFQENETISFSGNIKRFGNATYLSSVKCESGKNFADAKLMTTFSSRS